MGLLSSLTEIVTSGLTWAFNKIIKAGGWVVAALIAFTTWVTGTITAALTALVQPLIDQLPGFAGAFPEMFLWAFGLFVVPYIVPIFSCLFVRFIIRRLPVIG